MRQPSAVSPESEPLAGTSGSHPLDPREPRPLLYFTNGPNLRTPDIPGIWLQYAKDRPEQFAAYVIVYLASIVAAASALLPLVDLILHWSKWCLFGRIWTVLSAGLAVGSLYVISVHLLFYKVCLNYRSIVIQQWMEPALQHAEKALPLLCLLKGAWDMLLLRSGAVCDSSADKLIVGYLCCSSKYHWLDEATFISCSCYSLAVSSAASVCIYFAFDAEVKRSFKVVYAQRCPQGCEWRPDG